MKPQTYLRLSLLLPYAFWGVMVLLTYVQGFSAETSLLGEATELLNLGFIAALYLVGIFFWFVPYTLLALGLWIWSIRKPVRSMIRAFALSPFLLTALLLLEINLLSIIVDPAAFSSQGHVQDLLSLNLLATGLALGAGYFFVAVGFGIYTLLQRLNIVREARPESQPALFEAA